MYRTILSIPPFARSQLHYAHLLHLEAELKEHPAFFCAAPAHAQFHACSLRLSWRSILLSSSTSLATCWWCSTSGSTPTATTTSQTGSMLKPPRVLGGHIFEGSAIQVVGPQWVGPESLSARAFDARKSKPVSKWLVLLASYNQLPDITVLPRQKDSARNVLQASPIWLSITHLASHFQLCTALSCALGGRRTSAHLWPLWAKA